MISFNVCVCSEAPRVAGNVLREYLELYSDAWRSVSCLVFRVIIAQMSTKSPGSLRNEGLSCEARLQVPACARSSSAADAEVAQPVATGLIKSATRAWSAPSVRWQHAGVPGALRLCVLTAPQPQLLRLALARAASIRPACHALALLGDATHEPRRTGASAPTALTPPAIGSAGGRTSFAGLAAAEPRRLCAVLTLPPPVAVAAAAAATAAPPQLVATRTAWAALENRREASERAAPLPLHPNVAALVEALEGRRWAAISTPAGPNDEQRGKGMWLWG